MKEAPIDRITRRIAVLSMVTVSLLALAGCGGGEPSGPVVSMRSADYSFEAPDSIAGGRTTLRLTNGGKEPHELHVMRLKEGVLAHQFLQTLHQEGLDVALGMGSVEAHVATVDQGKTAEATVDLPAGDYVLICQILSPSDGVAHALKGMVKPLTVMVP